MITCNQTAWILNVAGERIAKIEIQRVEGKTVLCRLVEDNIPDDLRQWLRELPELIEMQAISAVDEVGDRVDQSVPEIELVDHTRIALLAASRTGQIKEMIRLSNLGPAAER